MVIAAWRSQCGETFSTRPARFAASATIVCAVFTVIRYEPSPFLRLVMKSAGSVSLRERRYRSSHSRARLPRNTLR